jgi:SAM-dependent methyltransferase
VWLAQRGWDVTAVDYAPAALERARAGAARRGVSLTLVEADVTAYRPEGTFDLVSLCYFHLEPDGSRRLLQAAADAVAPGGTLLYLGHDRSDDRLIETHALQAEHLSTPESVRDALAAKLSVVRAEVVEARLHGGDQTARTTLVVARRPGEGTG